MRKERDEKRKAETLTHRNVDLHFGFIEIEKICEAFFEFFDFVAKFWKFMKMNVGNLRDARHSRNFQHCFKNFNGQCEHFVISGRQIKS